MLHERENRAPAPAASQPFQIHYAGDRYQNGDAPNHLSYTVTNDQYSASPPHSSPRRARTPLRQGSAPEARRPEPVSLQQLQTPVAAPPPDDMEPQNISFIGNAEADALRHGIDRLHISSGTRTYRIPSPTRPSLGRDSFQRLEREEERPEKGFYISFDDDQPKRPKPPLRAKRGSPKKDRTPSADRSPERSPDEGWSERLQRQPTEEAFVVHRAALELGDAAPQRREAPPPAAEPAALVIGDVNVDPVSAARFERTPGRARLTVAASVTEFGGGDGAQEGADHADVAAAAAARGRGAGAGGGGRGSQEGARGRRQRAEVGAQGGAGPEEGSHPAAVQAQEGHRGGRERGDLRCMYREKHSIASCRTDPVLSPCRAKCSTEASSPTC